MDKKIAIITLPGNFNYGNRLQNYALTAILSQLSFQVVTLNKVRNPLIQRSINILKLVCHKRLSPEHYMSEQRLDSFLRFNSHLNIREIRKIDIPSVCNEFEYFIVGSDQVWNPNNYRKNFKWYFLKFADENKRIALAPSIGIDNLNTVQINELKMGLEGFRYLSVRENQGAKLIKEYTGREASVICDPTLILSPDSWRNISSDELTPKEPYVFAYLLGSPTAESQLVLDRVSDNGSKKIVFLSDNEKPNEVPAGPSQFISLIDHADHIVTDSFHASVFSAILQSPLTIVHRAGSSNMFSRLDSLAQMLGIQDKVFGMSEFDFDRANVWTGTSDIIEKERLKFMNYLFACLNS